MELPSTNYGSKQQTKITFTVAFSFLCVFLTNIIPAIQFQIFGNSLVQQLPKVLLGIAYLYALPSFIRLINFRVLTVICVFVATVTFNLIFQENFQQFLSTVTIFSYSCLPVILFSIVITDFKKLYSYFYKTSVFVSILLMILPMSGLLKFSEEYSMGFSYASVFYFIFLLNDFFFRKKISSALLLIPIFLVIFAYGSRGALVCILAFLIFRLIKNILQKKQMVQSFLLIVFIILTYLNFRNILLLVERMFYTLNIQSRTLSLILYNEIEYSAGRDVLYSSIIEVLKEDPLSIRGINADYNLLGIYSHNIVLELMYEFGVIIGFILLMTILFTIIFVLFKKYVYEFDSLIIIILAIWSSQLMISYSIWISIYFWFYIGLFLNTNSKNMETAT